MLLARVVRYIFSPEKDAAAVANAAMPAGQVHCRSPNRQAALQEPACWVRRISKPFQFFNRKGLEFGFTDINKYGLFTKPTFLDKEELPFGEKPIWQSQLDLSRPW